MGECGQKIGIYIKRVRLLHLALKINKCPRSKGDTHKKKLVNGIEKRNKKNKNSIPMEPQGKQERNPKFAVPDNDSMPVVDFFNSGLKLTHHRNGRRVYTFPGPNILPVAGTVESASNEYTEGIRKRKKSEHVDWNQRPKPNEPFSGVRKERTPPRTWTQWEEHIASKIIHFIVGFIPKRYNEMCGDVVDVTPWEQSLRVQWLDRGLYKRKILAAVVIGLMVTGVFIGAGYVPWRQVFGKDNIPEFKDAQGRILTNVVIPRMLEPDKHAGDASITDWIITGDPFEPLTPESIHNGYITITMDRSGTRKNVSLSMLYERMNSTAHEKYRCLCAAHMGIPLNVILFTSVGKRLQALRANPELPPAPNDFVIMTEPQPTVGSKAIVSTGPMKSNIQPTQFRVNHPDRVVVSFLTATGHKDKREFHGDDSACVVRCIELAWKEPIVDPVLGGILTVPASKRTKKGKVYVSED